MTTERIQRQIDRLLDEAETALAARDWATVRDRAQDALALAPENQDAVTFLAASGRALDGSPSTTSATETTSPTPTPPPLPTSFANGRYEVKKLLGEGGKKVVYLAHDAALDRDVAFALIKTEGLDDAGRTRIQREG
jgi:serine/threonine protein kinase